MRIVFAGSPAFALPALKALCAGSDGIAAVITQPDKEQGRKRRLTPTPVKEYALGAGLAVLDFARIREHAAEIRALGADIMITCAYGQLLTQEVLDCFPLGVWNLHASLLPEFRGASPIQSCILAGNEYTGITVMKTELALDRGGILLVKRCAVDGSTYGELEERLSHLAAEAAVEAVELIGGKDVRLLVQDEAKASYCKKIQKSDAKIDFSRSSADICRLIRAMNPQPVAFCNMGGQPLNILAAALSDGEGAAGEVIRADKRGIEVACGKGSIVVTRLIPAGGRAMSAADFVNGRKIKVGDRLD